MTATVTDLFCGAGGSSLGAQAAGMELVMAANHWQTAMLTAPLPVPGTVRSCV
jgi:DNA (cytosine-5)-methyltransferase 1